VLFRSLPSWRESGAPLEPARYIDRILRDANPGDRR